MKTHQMTKNKSLRPWDGKNYTFHQFDEAILNWCDEKWGDELGIHLWKDTLPESLEALHNEPGQKEWKEFCEMVYRHHTITDVKNALYLRETEVFWTLEFQERWIKHQRRILYNHVMESTLMGPQGLISTNKDGGMRHIRKILQDKY